MGFRRFFKALGKGVARAAPIAAGIAQIAGIPMVGSIANAIMLASELMDRVIQAQMRPEAKSRRIRNTSAWTIGVNPRK